MRTTEEQNWGPKPGETLDGRYYLERVVDAGGMGMVVLAQHLRMRRPVAIKLLHPKIADKPGYRARFQREVELASAIDHPNIVQCLDFGETNDDYLYLVMEMLEGRSLKDKLYEDGRLSTGETIHIALQLLDGMAAAHLAGVIHRDLKPGNIWIGEDHRGRDTVKILDFGLAKDLASNNLRITQTGSILGTASYLAPESIVVSQGGKASDVYALGLVMLEMLLGQKVFSGRNITQAFLQQLVLPARIPRRIWETDFGQIIADALRKHPSERPRDAEEMYQAVVRAERRLDDFRLERDELPPPNNETVAPAFLDELGAGRYRNLDTLRTLPAPEPYDRGAPAVDGGHTQRIVLDTLRSSQDLTPPLVDTPGVSNTPRPPGLLVAEQAMPTVRFERGPGSQTDGELEETRPRPSPQTHEPEESAETESYDAGPKNVSAGEGSSRWIQAGLALLSLVLVGGFLAVVLSGDASTDVAGEQRSERELIAQESAEEPAEQVDEAAPPVETPPGTDEDIAEPSDPEPKPEPAEPAMETEKAAASKEEKRGEPEARERQPGEKGTAMDSTTTGASRSNPSEEEVTKSEVTEPEKKDQEATEAEPSKQRPARWRAKPKDEKPSWDKHLRLSP